NPAQEWEEGVIPSGLGLYRHFADAAPITSLRRYALIRRNKASETALIEPFSASCWTFILGSVGLMVTLLATISTGAVGFVITLTEGLFSARDLRPPRSRPRFGFVTVGLSALIT